VTEADWVDADEALEEAARAEGAAAEVSDVTAPGALDRQLDEHSADEMIEDAHQAG
jgi:hypothetical protein